MNRFEFSDQPGDPYTVRVRDRASTVLYTWTGASPAEAVAFKTGWRMAERVHGFARPEGEEGDHPAEVHGDKIALEVSGAMLFMTDHTRDSFLIDRTNAARLAEGLLRFAATGGL